MKLDKKIALKSLRNIIVATAYIFAVSQIMTHGDALFGQADNSFTPFAVLLLFSVSAAIVGFLVFGQAVMLFLDNKQKAAIESVAFSILWLFIITMLALTVLALI